MAGGPRLPLTAISRLSTQVQDSTQHAGNTAGPPGVRIRQVRQKENKMIYKFHSQLYQSKCFRNCNPYHNNLHAADVLQTTHWFLAQAGLKVNTVSTPHWYSNWQSCCSQSWLSDLEIFSVLLSAIIHDFDHSGTTNNFHTQSASSLAVLYNDRSVLENHHVSSFFR